MPERSRTNTATLTVTRTAHSTTSVLFVMLPSAAACVRAWFNHRNQCGHQFRVQDVRVTAKKLAYRCPFCNGSVASSVMTGQITHRSVCGNRFYVKSGKVSEGTRQHAHKCPQCQTVVWTACASGRIRVRHKTPSGRQCPRSSWNSEEKKTSIETVKNGRCLQPRRPNRRTKLSEATKENKITRKGQGRCEAWEARLLLNVAV